MPETLWFMSYNTNHCATASVKDLFVFTAIHNAAQPRYIAYYKFRVRGKPQNYEEFIWDYYLK